MAKTKRRVNRPRTRVPHRVWVVSWGYRDSDPIVTWILSVEKYPTLGTVMHRVDKVYGQWLHEEADYREVEPREIDDDIAMYGPVPESYIKIVKELPSGERKSIETDFEFYGEAYIPRE